MEDDDDIEAELAQMKDESMDDATGTDAGTEVSKSSQMLKLLSQV